MQKQLVNFIINNRNKLTVILLVNLIVNINIGLVNYPYIDDIARQRQGIANFIAHYARYFSEYASWAFQGSRHLTDMGLTTHILSALIMTLTAIVVVYVFNEHGKISWQSTVASIIIGINPWFLEALSFRFDSPYICLSVLVSVLPFIFLKHGKRIYFFSSSIFAILLMCNSYQASSGIYIVTLLAFVFVNLLRGEKLINEVLNSLIAALSYSIGIGLYFIEMKLNPQLLERGDNTKIASLNNMLPTILENLKVYRETVRNQLANIWLYLVIVTLLIFIIQVILLKGVPFLKKILYLPLFLSLGFILSYGVYAFMSTTLADDRPRYIYGFGYFLSLILILSGNVKTPKKLWTFQMTAVSLLVYYLLSFSFTYASTLKYQKEEFENQTIFLADDLSDIGIDNINAVYINKFLKNSVVYDNTKVNYPILDELVPNNELLYWPNFMWFNSISHLDLNFQPKDTSNLDNEEYQLVLAKKTYDIYKKDNELFINMK